MSAGLNILVIGLCILLQGFFSGSEMVLLSSKKLRLRQKAKKGSRGAKLAFDMIHRPRWFLATTSTGTNMFVIISSVVAAAWFEDLFGPHSELWTIVILSPLLLLFGEIIPRSVFQQRATEIAPKIAYTLWTASRVISPITFVVFWVSKLFYGLVGKESIERHAFVTREELKLLLNIPGEGSDLQTKEKKLIRRVFHLTESDVADVMVPLIHVTAVPLSATVKDAKHIARRTGYSRLPVYKDRIDNLIGIIHTFDLIDAPDNQKEIRPFVREVPFVPEVKRAYDLLRQLQKNRNSIAIVVDEYGGAVGIITIEDLVEEVVGEIHDEYDSRVRPLVRLSRNRYLVNARTEIEYINERLNLNLPKEDYETLGGFLLKHFGKIPKKGETLKYRKVKFTVRFSTNRLIHQVVVDLPETDAKPPSAK